MAAMLFLTIALFGLMGVNVYTSHATLSNRNRQIANLVASNQLAVADSILRVNFHISSDHINTPRMTSVQYPQFDFVLEDLGFEDAGQRLRGVRSRVFWTEDGMVRSYALATTFYDY